MRNVASLSCAVLMVAALAVGCGGEGGIRSADLVGAPDVVTGAEPRDALGGASLGGGSPLEVVANANLRGAPSASAPILLVIPSGSRVETVAEEARDGFYKVTFLGREGWAFGAHLRQVENLGATEQEITTTDIIARAKTGVGFSYWWGHGRWLTSGATSTNKGTCSGSCPSCTHSGSYGADCSGYVAKAWAVPDWNTDIGRDAHPYSTDHFYNRTDLEWSRVNRSYSQKGDAFVYRSSGAGHIMLYEAGDPWGTPVIYEAAGCSTGIAYRSRTVSTSYLAIRRKNLGSVTTPPAPPVSIAVVGGTTPNAYWLADNKGGVFTYGNLGFYGSMGGQPLNRPVVGMARTADAGGYWLVSDDGGIFAFGNAGFHGSLGGTTLNKPIVSIVSTSTGGGYWLVGSDGGIFSFGDAGFYGSMGGQVLNKPIVGMARTANSGGYWLVASDGGIFSFGNAAYHGSGVGLTSTPFVGMAAKPDGTGYWLVTSTGAIYAFGSAQYHGGMNGTALNAPISSISSTSTGNGYWMIGKDGGVFTFGDAVFAGAN